MEILDGYKLEAEINGSLTKHIKLIPDTTQEHRNRQVTETWTRVKAIGRGGFGEVFLQKEEEQDQLRAVKVIRKGLQRARGYDYLREVVLMARSHDLQHFPEFLGWYEDEEKLYIAMEFFPLGDLSKYVREPLPESDARCIVLQIAAAVEILHSKGIAHRDVKPENIFVCRGAPSWWVKLGDFGISKCIQSNDTSLHTPFGGSHYIAPEIYGEDEVGFYTSAVDIWSLGCILFWILTLRSPKPLWKRVIRGKDVTCEDLQDVKLGPDGLRVLQRCLSMQPEQRPCPRQIRESAWNGGIPSDEPFDKGYPGTGSSSCSDEQNLVQISRIERSDLRSNVKTWPTSRQHPENNAFYLFSGKEVTEEITCAAVGATPSTSFGRLSLSTMIFWAIIDRSEGKSYLCFAQLDAKSALARITRVEMHRSSSRYTIPRINLICPCPNIEGSAAFATDTGELFHIYANFEEKPIVRNLGYHLRNGNGISSLKWASGSKSELLAAVGTQIIVLRITPHFTKTVTEWHVQSAANDIATQSEWPGHALAVTENGKCWLLGPGKQQSVLYEHEENKKLKQVCFCPREKGTFAVADEDGVVHVHQIQGSMIFGLTTFKVVHKGELIVMQWEEECLVTATKDSWRVWTFSADFRRSYVHWSTPRFLPEIMSLSVTRCQRDLAVLICYGTDNVPEDNMLFLNRVPLREERSLSASSEWISRTDEEGLWGIMS